MLSEQAPINFKCQPRSLVLNDGEGATSSEEGKCNAAHAAAPAQGGFGLAGSQIREWCIYASPGIFHSTTLHTCQPKFGEAGLQASYGKYSSHSSPDDAGEFSGESGIGAGAESVCLCVCMRGGGGDLPRGLGGGGVGGFLGRMLEPYCETKTMPALQTWVR